MIVRDDERWSEDKLDWRRSSRPGKRFLRRLAWRGALDLTPGSAGLRLFDKYCEVRGYHLPGEHDQERHGDWAEGQGSSEYKRAGDMVSGLKVRDEVPNLSSISSSLNDWEELPGIREVPLSAFDPEYKPRRDDRTKALAAAINASKEINPLIVAIDDEGPYIIEGGHRFDAMYLLGLKSFPAVVVMDNEAKAPKYVFPKKLYHLPGEHEQESHGNWASGGGEGAGSSQTAKGITGTVDEITDEIYDRGTNWPNSEDTSLRGSGLSRETVKALVQHNQAFEAKLTTEQRAAFSAYTASGDTYKKISDCVRRGNCTPETNALVREMDNAMRRAALPTDVVVYRNFRTPERLMDLQPGDTFIDLGFTSATLHPKAFPRPQGITARILLRKGTRAVYMLNLAHKLSEYEVLMGRGTRFKVTGYKRDHRLGKWVYDLEVE